MRYFTMPPHDRQNPYHPGNGTASFCLPLAGLLVSFLCIAPAHTAQAEEPPHAAAMKVTGYAIAVNDSGNAFIAGTSTSSWGTPVHPYTKGTADCFVAKLSEKGALQWHTFLGGEHDDGCRAIALDTQGNIYVTGESASSWADPVRLFSGGGYDGFVAKLDGSGNLKWNTFLGGGLYDGGYGLCLDNSGDVIVTGNSADTWGKPRTPHTERNHDAFVARLDKNGSLLWNTFLGGEDYDGGYAVTVDGRGNLYVAGESSADWGKPVNNFSPGYYGNYDAFAAKLDRRGTLVWHTFMGGIGSDFGQGIAVDREGTLYVTGNSNISWGQPLTPHNGNHDAFAAALDDNGVLQWHTFMGSNGDDYGRAIATHWSGDIFLTGQYASSRPAPENGSGEAEKAFIIKLSRNGTMQWNNFAGEAGTDFGRGITASRIGNIYLTGSREGHVFVAQFNNAGALRWQTNIGKK